MPEKRLSPEFIRFLDPGDTAEGVLVQIREQEIRGRQVRRAILDTGDGRQEFLLTNQLEILDSVDFGTPIRVVYEGEEPTSGGQKVKIFSVYEITPEKSKAKADKKD